MSISLIPPRLYPSCQLIQLINHLEKKKRKSQFLLTYSSPTYTVFLYLEKWCKKMHIWREQFLCGGHLEMHNAPWRDWHEQRFCVALHNVVVAEKLLWRTCHRTQNEHISTNSRTGCSIQCLSGSKQPLIPWVSLSCNEALSIRVVWLLWLFAEKLDVRYQNCCPKQLIDAYLL